MYLITVFSRILPGRYFGMPTILLIAGFCAPTVTIICMRAETAQYMLIPYKYQSSMSIKVFEKSEVTAGKNPVIGIVKKGIYLKYFVYLANIGVIEVFEFMVDI